MMPTTDNSKMPDSETFKERFLATAKNKDEILKVLNENKDNLISNDTLDNPQKEPLCKLPLIRRLSKT